MRHLATLFFGSCLASLPAFATIVQTATPAGLGSNDFTNWSQLGGNNAAIAASFGATSNLALSISGSFAGGTGAVEKVCPSAPVCGWITSGTGFSAGDSVIFANNGSQGTGPLTLTFPAILGVGAWLQGDLAQAFTGQIQLFNGVTSLATFTVTSNAGGDPVFLGALASGGTTITKAVFSITACGSGCDVNSFAIDQLFMTDITGVPEPATLFLVGAALIGLGWKRRRRRYGKPEELKS